MRQAAGHWATSHRKWHSIMTQKGTEKFLDRPPADEDSVIMPMPFWAKSFGAMAEAEMRGGEKREAAEPWSPF